jgi:hypothetical protein
MKKTLLSIGLTVMCFGAFAQGKINIVNDSNHLVYFGYALRPFDCALAGTLVPATLGDDVFYVHLYGYAGTGAGSIALLTTIPMSASVPGTFGPFNWNSPLPGGSPSTFQVRIYDSLGLLAGLTQVFTMQPSASIAYNSLANPRGSALSTWASGTVPVPGGFGAISVMNLGPICPEPSSMVLAGLGLASLLSFHRRK